MILRFKGYPHLQVYAGGDVPGGAWLVGTKGEVPDAVGVRLLEQHPAAFVEVAGKSPKRPKRSRALSAEVEPSTSVLDGSVKALRAALATGEHDGALMVLLRAENAGKTRAGAIAAIEERIAAVSE